MAVYIWMWVYTYRVPLVVVPFTKAKAPFPRTLKTHQHQVHPDDICRVEYFWIHLGGT